MINKRSISIFGIYPPPYGGLSNHIKRVTDILINEGMLELVYNFGRTEKSLSKQPEYVRNINISTRFDIIGYIYWLFRFGLHDKSKLIHFHNNENGSFLILIMKFVFKKKILVTFHDQMRLTRKPRWFRFWYVTPFLFQLFKQKDIFWIAVNENIKSQLLKKGVNQVQISIIPAYVNNVTNNSTPLRKDILKFSSRKTPLFTMYAMATILYEGVDLYGIDISLQLIERLKSRYKEIGLIICIPGTISKLVMESYNQYIARNHIEDNVLFVEGNILNIYELWKLSDIFLRPTCTDGDSLSVREALEVNTVVLASDAAKRPEGVIIFRNRDINDFETKALYVLENIKVLKMRKLQYKDPFEDLFRLYQFVLNQD